MQRDSLVSLSSHGEGVRDALARSFTIDVPSTVSVGQPKYLYCFTPRPFKRCCCWDARALIQIYSVGNLFMAVFQIFTLCFNPESKFLKDVRWWTVGKDRLTQVIYGFLSVYAFFAASAGFSGASTGEVGHLKCFYYFLLIDWTLISGEVLYSIIMKSDVRSDLSPQEVFRLRGLLLISRTLLMLFMSWVVFSRMKSAREERARALGTSRRRSTLEVPDDIMPSLPPSYWTQRMTFWWRRTVFTNKSARGSVSSVPGLQAGDASDDGSSFAHSPSAAGGGALYPPLSTSVRDKEKPGSASPGGLTLSAYRSGGSSAGSVTHSSHWHFTPERHMPAVREEGEEGRELESSLPSSVRGELNQSRGYVKEVNAYDLDSLRSPAPDSHRSHVG